jgi:hypothetical protein
MRGDEREDERKDERENEIKDKECRRKGVEGIKEDTGICEYRLKLPYQMPLVHVSSL